MAEDLKMFSMPVLEPIPDWNIEDVNAYRMFLATPTGTKLSDRSKVMVSSSSVRLCGDVVNTAHSAGSASGMNEFLKWQRSLASKQMLEKLSQPTGAQVDNTSNSDGQAALLARFSP